MRLPMVPRAAPGSQEQRRRTQRSGKPSPRRLRELIVVSLPLLAQAECPRGACESCSWVSLPLQAQAG